MRARRLWIGVLGWYGFLAPAGLGAQGVENTSYRALDGTRVLQHSVVVPASLEDVWAAFTTTDGVRSFAAPVAQVDFRLGGIWESSFNPSARIGDPANIRNRFVAFVPPRMVAIQVVAAPPDFPAPDVLREIVAVIELAEIGPGQVKVTESMSGFRDTPEHDRVYRLFDRGNEVTLRWLYRRFADGPIDWEQVLGGGQGAPGGADADRREPERAEPPAEFDRYILAIYTKGPTWTADVTADLRDQQARHLGHLERMVRERWVVVAGPLQDLENDGQRRGIVLLTVESLARAHEIMRMDPHVRNGHMGYELYRFFTAKGALAFPLAQRHPARRR